MQLDPRLPHTPREGAIYGAIICFLTSLFMTVLNVYWIMGGLHQQALLAIFKWWPLMFVIAMVIEPMLIGRLAEKAMHKLSPPTDSGNAKIMFRLIFTVFGMSLAMTSIGIMLSKGLHANFAVTLWHQWPRNFFIVLLAEALVIQPIARTAMLKLHQKTIAV
ncbi:hypothetical protein ADP71_03100 [Vitreoscilla sp. C1]|uniref:DUF2798 domain-containing protein n=1 Tax=Vitreoscilla sp. (strain C1) TaxID=96942 RepID=UPI000CDC2CE0|nr:DUF2798 domain-containing protein [Vitreoscilla sp. C1]AUZ04123.1 hypothetical protein ADP71_03100 [Vitreoscilla sp. C1]